MITLSQAGAKDRPTLRNPRNLGGCAGQPLPFQSVPSCCIRRIALHPSTGWTDVHDVLPGLQALSPHAARLGAAPGHAGEPRWPCFRHRVESSHSTVSTKAGKVEERSRWRWALQALQALQNAQKGAARAASSFSNLREPACIKVRE